MIEQYVAGFAQAYDEHWHPYPKRAAAELLRLHQHLAPGADRRVLDIGCGTGIVAEHLQENGYAVTGVDISAAMLARARQRLGESAVLVHGDATNFTVDSTYPLAVSTYDLPNHLGSLDRITAYLRAAYAAVEPGGVFAFDVATPTGLAGINAITVRETDNSILLYRGALNEQAGYGFYRISGVVRAPDGRYDRFETTITNSIVPLDQLLSSLREVGWQETYIAAPTDLCTPLGTTAECVPDSAPRVYLISRHP